MLWQLVDGLGGSGLAMPVEVVQFCWKYNAERLKTLPEVAGCEVQDCYTLKCALSLYFIVSIHAP